jgi:transcriptional regulator with XRE-family HTH domain
MYQRIRSLREDRDLTQTQIAQMLGMSQTGYSKYETGENDIPTTVLIKLADFYGTTTDYLLERTDKTEFSLRTTRRGRSFPIPHKIIPLASFVNLCYTIP